MSGPEMVPVVSRARVRGAPLGRWLGRARIEACVERTVAAGGRVVALRKKEKKRLKKRMKKLEKKKRSDLEQDDSSGEQPEE